MKITKQQIELIASAMAKELMDDDTELYIIPANLVEGSPYDTGYFIY